MPLSTGPNARVITSSYGAAVLVVVVVVMCLRVCRVVSGWGEGGGIPSHLCVVVNVIACLVLRVHVECVGQLPSALDAALGVGLCVHTTRVMCNRSYGDWKGATLQ